MCLRNKEYTPPLYVITIRAFGAEIKAIKSLHNYDVELAQAKQNRKAKHNPYMKSHTDS